MITLLLTLSLGSAHAAGCPQASSRSELHQALGAAEEAFASMDLAGFQAQLTAADTALACLEEAVTPADAADLHGAHGLAAFLAEDRASTVACFRAATSLEPTWALPEAVAPEGHPLREQVETARVLPASPRAPLRLPKGLSLWVDGSPASDRPADQPAVLQGFERGGAVVGTEWLDLGETLPPWAEPPSSDEPARSSREGSGRSGPKLALLVPTAVTGVGAGLLYGMAWSSRATYLDEGTAYADLDDLRSRNNTTTLASGILGGVALGLGTATVLTWEW